MATNFIVNGKPAATGRASRVKSTSPARAIRANLLQRPQQSYSPEGAIGGRHTPFPEIPIEIPSSGLRTGNPGEKH